MPHPHQIKPINTMLIPNYPKPSLEDIFAAAHDMAVICIIANFLSDVDKVNWFIDNEFRKTAVLKYDSIG
jgi:hypothetical protein